MLRRKPSKIEVQLEDKEELEEARKRSAAATNTATTGAASVLHHLDKNKDPSNKSQRIGI
ncbi:hypothetical protein FRX31_025150 [Thalictrum thalictroides]|uniref:Uncharacterized protein n=1 Tax=Thalictrum thalictroides TaxID=46969 RepID=A0A7J6VJG6_THATH|nr:hypothetical protein FRX31_025150 [Thalictrum thalictroides]